MSLHRIYAVILKNLYYLWHSLDRKTELFYWPVIDLILWGITGLYFKELAPENNVIVVNIVSGLILWYILWQGSSEINMSLLAELWHRNLVNMFSTPLKFSEFIIAFLISSIGKAAVMVTVTAIGAGIMYSVGIGPIGFWIIPLGLILIMTGWTYAFAISGMILRYGTRVQSISWTMVFLISPFSAVYYPLDILPNWAQQVAAFVPTSYVFESMRELTGGGEVELKVLGLSFVLTLIYMLLTLVWLQSSYRKSLETGLVKLM